MAVFLPLELVEEIAAFLTQPGLLAMRAACRSFALITTPLAFREITFQPTPKSIDERLPRLFTDLSHLAPFLRRIRVCCVEGKEQNGACVRSI
jgi:hypothetical protein